MATWRALAHPAGALHAAGVLHDRLVQRLEAQAVEAALAPKAVAATHLHALSERAPPTAMVLFSSSAAAFGSVGQANYSAANACLDSLALCRASIGAVVSGLQLPLVSGAGMGQ